MVFFQVRISTIFYKKWGTLNEIFLTWNTLTCNILSKKSWFLFSDKAQVQKSGGFVTSFFCTVRKKRKKLEVIWLIAGTSIPLFPVLFCLFTPFLLVFFVFHRKNVALLHLMNRYKTSASQCILKGKGIKVSFWYQWIMQCNLDSFCEHMTRGDDIYSYGCVSLLAPECAVYIHMGASVYCPLSVLCIFFFMCVWYQIRVPAKNHINYQTSVNLLPCRIKYKVVLVLRYQGLTFIDR